jgi:hypothetical protein
VGGDLVDHGNRVGLVMFQRANANAEIMDCHNPVAALRSTFNHNSEGRRAMTRRDLAIFVAVIVLVLGAVVGADAPAVAGKKPELVRDPVCVGWNGGWVVFRYIPKETQWMMWTSPPAPKATGMLSATSQRYVAVIDPRKQCMGWLFDLHAKEWRAIPASPLGGPPASPSMVMVAFVDEQLVVWGQPGGGKQGGIYDPAALQWRQMAVAPVSPRFRAASAVLGKKVIFWGGYGNSNPARPQSFGPLTDGAVYDLPTNQWEKMPAPPVPMSTYGYVWAQWNEKLILFGGRTGRAISRIGAIYDSATKTWDGIAECPFDVGQQSTCAVSGDKLLVWSGASPAAAAAGRTEYSREAALYDLAKKEWRKVPNAPVDPRLLGFRHVEGDQIVMWGGWISGNAGGTFLKDGVIYDVAKGVWQTIPDLPGEVPYALHPGW